MLSYSVKWLCGLIGVKSCRSFFCCCRWSVWMSLCTSPSGLDRLHAVNSCKVDTFCMISTHCAALNTRIRLISLRFTRGALYMIQITCRLDLANTLPKFDPHAMMPHIDLLKCSRRAYSCGIAKLIHKYTAPAQNNPPLPSSFFCVILCYPFANLKLWNTLNRLGSFPPMGWH